MRRYAKNFVDKTASQITNAENHNPSAISEGLDLPAYITVNYVSNVSNDSLDTSITTSTLNNVSSSYTDLMYIDRNGAIHEIGNSEIIFDSFFDYIIRGNERENTLISVENNSKLINGIKLNKDIRGE